MVIENFNVKEFTTFNPKGYSPPACLMYRNAPLVFSIANQFMQDGNQTKILGEIVALFNSDGSEDDILSKDWRREGKKMKNSLISIVLRFLAVFCVGVSCKARETALSAETGPLVVDLVELIGKAAVLKETSVSPKGERLALVVREEWEESLGNYRIVVINLSNRKVLANTEIKGTSYEADGSNIVASLAVSFADESNLVTSFISAPVSNLPLIQGSYVWSYESQPNFQFDQPIVDSQLPVLLPKQKLEELGKIAGETSEIPFFNVISNYLLFYQGEVFETILGWMISSHQQFYFMKPMRVHRLSSTFRFEKSVLFDQWVAQKLQASGAHFAVKWNDASDDVDKAILGFDLVSTREMKTLVRLPGRRALELITFASGAASLDYFDGAKMVRILPKSGAIESAAVANSHIAWLAKSAVSLANALPEQDPKDGTTPGFDYIAEYRGIYHHRSAENPERYVLKTVDLRQEEMQLLGEIDFNKERSVEIDVQPDKKQVLVAHGAKVYRYSL